MEAVTARRIAGRGTAESRWLRSSWVRRMPRTDASALLDGAGRLVVVAPHPDDEVLGCGGLMKLASGCGREILVVSVSDGEHCCPGDPFWTPERLRRARRRELDAALAALGLGAARTLALGVDDGGVLDSLARVAEQLSQQLRAGDRVLATWACDGHPDHEACSRAARIAADARGCRLLEYPVWGWHWAEPSSPELNAVRAWRLDLPDDVLSAKSRAIACFATQTGDCQPAVAVPVLPPHVRRRFERPFEVFFA
ncbi:MAG TPA: PIG-L family deacetylase [Dokdonella sp.]